MAKEETDKQFIQRLAKQEKVEKAARIDRLVRGLRNYGTEMFDGELRNIEEAMHPASGRVALDRLR